MDPKSSELVAETKQTVVQLKEQLDSQVSCNGTGDGVSAASLFDLGWSCICEFLLLDTPTCSSPIVNN